jgi:hypothetical protein
LNFLDRKPKQVANHYFYFALFLVSVGLIIAGVGSSPVAAGGAFIGAGLFALADAIQARTLK